MKSVYDNYENFEKTVDGLMEKIFDTPDDESITVTPEEKEILKDQQIEIWDNYDDKEAFEQKRRAFYEGRTVCVYVRKTEAN